MKKLKKSSKNKKFKVLIIYGAPAVGKFTVAKELAKKINFNIFHNHSVNDLIWEFFPRGSHSADILKEEISFLLFKQIAENHLNTILTSTHFTDFVSSTGLTNMGFYKKIEKIIKKQGGSVFYVQLIASPNIILKRAIHPNRKKHKKLVDSKVMKNVLKENNWTKPEKLKNNLIINNTKLSPKKVSSIIIKHFKLR